MITIYQSIYQTSDPHYISLDYALRRIKDCDQKEVIEEIRNGDKSKKQSLKIDLFNGQIKEKKDD